MANYLVCEGARQGIDERALNALVIQPNSLNFLLTPAGGCGGIGPVRAYLHRPGHDVAISIVDRDYRLSGTAAATWANQAGNSFIWRRHELENHLLHRLVVLELFNDFRAAPAGGWAAALPATEADVAALLRTLAAPRLADHAAWLLQEELITAINGVGNLKFGPAAPAAPPAAPAPGQAQWLPVLQQEAARLCQASTAVAALPDLQPGAVATRYHALLTQFQNPAFLTSDGYLIDMGGKELVTALARHLNAQGAPAGLNRQVLADELLNVLQRIYQPNVLFAPDDFAELAAVLAQY